MRQLTFRVLIVFAAMQGALAAQQPLRTLAEIRRVTDSQVAGQLVDFEATVTYTDSLWNFFFAQDGDNAIFVHGVVALDIHKGEAVRIEGALTRGDLLPFVSAANVETLGRRKTIEPLPIDLSEIRIGDHDCRYAEVTCDVRQAVVNSEDTLLYCQSGDKPLFVKVKHAINGFPSVQNIVGRQVRCRGCMGAQLSDPAYVKPGESKGRFLAVKLFCESPESVELLGKPSPADSIRVCNMSNLASEDWPTGKFQTHGQVSLVDHGQENPQIVVFDGGHAIRFHVQSYWDLRPGMVLRLKGEKVINADGDAEYDVNLMQQLNLSSLSQPAVVTIPQALSQSVVDQRIAVEGKPVRIREMGDETYLTLRDGSHYIDARIQLDARESLASVDPEIAKRVSVTGVASYVARDGYDPNVEIVVARADDLELIRSRVSPTRLIAIGLALLGAAVGIGLLWIKTLRLQVAQTTQDARDRYAQLRSSYDAVEDGILAMDRQFKVLAVNREFLRISEAHLQTGDSVESLPEVMARRLLRPEEFRRQWHDLLTVDSASLTTELEMNGDGTTCVVMHSAPIVAAGGQQPIGRIVTFRDETENRQLQTELLHSNKLEAIGRLVGGVAHDFNNILTAVTANLSIARLDKNVTVGDVETELSHAESAAFRGAEIVRRLLTFSSKSVFVLEPCSINSIVGRLVDLIRHAIDASVKFEFDLSDDNPFVEVEGAAIEQVLMNLYVNAKDAMPDGGTIWTTTSVHFDSVAKRDVVVISVEDDGVGVPSELRDRIFEPFFTTKEKDKGTGLGLSASYRVIEQHGGTLQHKDRPGRGSEFRIVLPLANSINPPVEQDVMPEPPKASGCVLVVDDEDLVRGVAIALLEHLGFGTLAAESGQEAIDLLARDVTAVDAVLLDITMPGLSGRETLRRIKDRWPAMPVVLCSGYFAGQEDESEVDRSTMRADATIAKPFRMKQLDSVIKNVMMQERTA